MKVFVCCNQKGGVGKTSFSFHLVQGLRGKGGRILAVDLDPQGNLSTMFGKSSCSALEIFAKTAQLVAEPALEGAGAEVFGIVTADAHLAQAEAQLSLGSFTRLQRLLRAPNQPWDYAVVDCPPSLGLFTVNALAAADYVVVVSEPSLFSLLGLKGLMERIEEVREEGVNPGIAVAGIVLNKSTRTTVAAESMKLLADDYPNLTLKSIIPQSVKVEEAVQRGMPVWEYAPGNPASEAIRNAVEEIVSRVNAGGQGTNEAAA